LPDGRTKQILEIGRPLKNREQYGNARTVQDVTNGNRVENLISANRQMSHLTIAKLGSWKHDLITNDSIWSKDIMKFFELENCQQISSMLLPGQEFILMIDRYLMKLIKS
jgi:hypothetical protein